MRNATTAKSRTRPRTVEQFVWILMVRRDTNSPLKVRWYVCFFLNATIATLSSCSCYSEEEDGDGEIEYRERTETTWNMPGGETSQGYVYVFWGIGLLAFVDYAAF